MNTDYFKTLYKNLDNNINEIKTVIKKPKLLESPGHVKIMERIKYLFYSSAKLLVDIGHNIILENNFREPLNRADIFISLAEREIVMPAIVPGIKKAILSLPKIADYPYSETLEIISESIEDLHKCLDSFSVYFSLKDK